MIPSFVFKHRAWAAIKPWLQVLVIIGLLAVMPGLINDVAGQLMSEDVNAALGGPAQDMMNFSMQPMPETMTEEEEAALLAEAEALSTAFMDACKAFFLQGDGWILMATFAVEMLLTPVFMAPLYGALLDVQRKKEISIGGALADLRRGPKMLLLILWMALRVGVWTLPGLALMLAAFFVPLLGDALLWVGFTVAMVMYIRAMLHYVLAPIVLMDRPELSLNGCIRASLEVMRHRKMEYFMLRVSFVGWHLLLNIVSMLAVNVVMMALVLTVRMAANLLLTIYINGTVVGFWDAYGVQLQKKADPTELDRSPDHPGEDLN